MVQDVELLTELLTQMEGSSLDFKRDQYKLDSDKQKASFVKDIVCMANTPREGPAYIVVGVSERNGSPDQVIGISEHPDPATFQNLVNGRTNKLLRFAYREIRYMGVNVGLFEIPVDKRSVPIMARRTVESFKSGVTYTRRSAQNYEADDMEIRRIIEWSGAANGDTGDDHVQQYSWESLARACDHFDSARLYVAVFGSQQGPAPDDCEALSLVNWHLVIDFDRDTDSDGLFSGVSPYLSKRTSLRITALDQPVGIVSPSSCIWIAARGLHTSPSTVRTHAWREWNQVMAGPLADTMRKMAEVTEPTPVTAVIFSGEESYTDTVCSLLDQAFKSRINFVIANERPDDFAPLASQFEGTSVAISLPAVCSGLRSMRPPEGPSEAMELPSFGGGAVVVPEDRARWLEEELEVVHKNAGLSASEHDEELEEFLMGNLISWHALNLGVDISRTSTPALQQRVTQELESRTTRRLNLWHWPGGGGTTVARRIAWNIHNQYPTIVAKRVVPESLTDRLRLLFELTRMPVLALIEDSVTNHNDLDGLYDRLRSGNIPVVLLTVGRRSTAATQAGSFYVGGMLDEAEAAAFAGRLAAQVPDRRRQLEQLRNARRSQSRTPFYFGLTAFGKDFAALEPYVSHRLGEASEALLEAVNLVCLLYHYGQRSTPIQLISSILSLPRSKTILASSVLPILLQELFVQENDRSIRPAHELIAEEILQQVLGQQFGEKRNWTLGLAQCAVEVIEYCADHHDHAGGVTTDLVRSVIIERGTQETPAGLLEGQFSKLIDEIPSSDGQRRVLERLTELFPDEAHFFAHLGRFYTRRAREHSLAREIHLRSLQIAPQDPVLHHMAGMASRGELDELLDGLDEASIQREEENVQRLVNEALARFETSQELDPRREHSYISAIELITKVVTTVGRLKGYNQATAEFLVAPGEVWYRELVDNAETLMAALVLVRAGEEPSGYLRRAQAGIDQAYGDLSRAIEGWTNLLGRTDMYHPPLRRNIINAYLTRRNRDWARLTQRELNRVAQLAQENLEEQPHSDQNLRIWFRAVRALGDLPLGHIAEQLTYKRVMHPTIDTLYYLYIVKFLQADTGGGQATDDAMRTIGECARQAANLPHRTRSFEWLGQGSGIQALVHEKSMGPWDPSSEFWSSTEKLRPIEGRISSIRAPQTGEIELPNGLKVFFVPSRGRVEGGYLRGRDERRRVSFFLGFSYDGLRAWSVGEPDPS